MSSRPEVAALVTMARRLGDQIELVDALGVPTDREQLCDEMGDISAALHAIVPPPRGADGIRDRLYELRIERMAAARLTEPAVTQTAIAKICQISTESVIKALKKHRESIDA